MAIDKIQSESINLTDNFAFTGTVTGAGFTPDNFLQADMGNASSITGLADDTYIKATYGSPRVNTTASATSGWDATNNKFVVDSNNEGKYFVSATMECHTGGSTNSSYDQFNIAIYVGGSIKYYSINRQEPNMSGGGCNISGIVNLTSGDYLEIYVRFNIGPSSATWGLAGNTGNNISICRLSDT